MTYTSTIGQPLNLLTSFSEDEMSFFKDFVFVFNGYYKKDTFLNGFKLPNNGFFSSKEILFNTYNLWENTNGWGVEGVEIVPLKTTWNTFLTRLPIFVGDKYQGKFFKSVSAGYDRKNGIWISEIAYMDALPTFNEITENAYTIKITEVLDAIYDLIDKYYVPTSNALIEATIDGKTILRPSAIADKQAIKQKIEELKEVQL